MAAGPGRPTVLVRIAPRADGDPRPVDAVRDAMAFAATRGAAGKWSIAAAASQAASSGDLVVEVDADTIVSGVSLERMLRVALARGVPVRARHIVRSKGLGRTLVRVALAVDVGMEEKELASAAVADLGTAPAWSIPSAASLLEDVIPAEMAKARDALAAALTAADEPELSIIMRTQLRRPEATREALLSLAAQTDPRFELILIGHDVSAAALEQALVDQPAWLRERTRVMTVAGGTRARPLNTAFDVAKGTHVAVLDDDDLALPDWVGAFLRAARSVPNRLLRTRVAVQPVVAADWPDDVVGQVDAGPAELPYPERYDLVEHLRVNLTPFMAFAFPRSWLVASGGVDEDLEVCEDWDLSLRAASELGVTDLPDVTAVYRRWMSGGDSYSTHETEVWQRDMERVIEKADARPLLLGPGSARDLVGLSYSRLRDGELEAVYASTSWRLVAAIRRMLPGGGDPGRSR